MFSELVDAVADQAKHSSRKTDIARFANATIRELQSLAFFKKDMTEDQLTVDGDPFTWTQPVRFRDFESVRYPSISGQLYPPELDPGKQQVGQRWYYYKGPGYVIFKGCGSSGNLIDVAYYSIARQFAYYETAARPAVYDRTAETWTYLDAYDGTDALNEQGQDLVSNWLLKDWYYIIQEGCLAKLYKLLGDPTASSSFALYKSYQQDLLAMELHKRRSNA